MRKSIAALMAVFIAALILLISASALAKEKNYAEGELLVKFRKSAGKQKRDNAHAKAGSQRLKHFEFIDVEHIRLKPGMSVEEAIALYSADPDVEYAEPNMLRTTMVAPFDSSYASQWGPKKVQAPEMWDIINRTMNTDPSYIIAVIDSGISNHTDLDANMWHNTTECVIDGTDNDFNGYIDDCRGWDFVGNDPNPDDNTDHGTRVAGVIGAVGDNANGIAGMLWDVKLMNLRFIQTVGSNNIGLLSDEIAAINYAMGKGVKVINASFGGPCSATTECTSEYNAIKAFCDSGGILIAAAGNSGMNMELYGSLGKVYPASFDLPCIISVASSGQTDELSLSSNYGSVSVDLAAPGESIISTSNNGTILMDLYSTGTSFAAPHVTGIVGLVWAAQPSWSRDEVIKRVITASEFKASLNDKVVSGGRANAFNTLLPVPANVNTTVLGDNDIKLTWDPVALTFGYHIYVREDGSGWWNDLGSTAGTTATSSGLIAGTKYHFAVRAIMGPDTVRNLSAYNSVSATTSGVRPAAPVPEAEPKTACFIATAAYGSPDAPEVRQLREFRDNVLMKSAPGRAFVSLYYRLSPPMAEFISQHDTLRAAARASLYPLGAAIGHPGLFGIVALGLCSGGAFVVTYTIKKRARRRLMKHDERQAGFTLLEVIIVVLILGMLAAIIAPRLVGRTEDARITQCKMQMRNIEAALRLFKLDNHFYPATEQGLEALIRKSTVGRDAKNFRTGGYLAQQRVPADPWGNPFIYTSPGSNGEFDLISLGADGAEGGEGENADIKNWEL